MRAWSSPGRRRVKSSESPASRGAETWAISMSSLSRPAIRSSSAVSETICRAYSFWASIHARVSGLSWSSSQR